MSRRSISLPARLVASAAFLTAGVASVGAAQTPATPGPSPASAAIEPAVAAANPVQAVIKRRLSAPAPAGTDAIRVSILGDGSGAKVQIRLLSPTSSAVGGVEAYYASAPVVLDYKGWKTVILPLSEFTFQSEQSPETNSSTASDTLFSLLPTINTLQIAVTAAPTAKVFVDDLVWATAVSGPTDPSLGVIDDFETAPATPSAALWNPTGDYEQLRAAQVGSNRVAAFVKTGQGSLQLVVRPASLDEKQLYAPSLVTRLKKQATLPYALYVRPPFQPIRPESAPSPQELASPPRLDVTACAGESEPVTFSVFSAVDLKNATVKAVGPFRSESGQSELPLSAISLHVIRLGDGKPRTDLSAPVPELIMKDDREELEGDLPAVRLTGDPLTDIPAGTSKQFWVTVNVPRNQVNSIYSGQLVFSALGMKPTTLPLRVNILPMQLRTAFLQYGIDLRSRLSPDGAAAGERVMTPEAYTAQLMNVRDHGFKIVTISDPVSSLPQALSLYKQAGLALNGPVVVNTPLRTQEEIQQVEALRAGAGLSSAFEIYYKMPSDLASAGAAAASPAPTPGKNEPAGPLGEYVKVVRKASNNKALIVAPVGSKATYDSLSPALSSVFAPVFAASSDYTSNLVATGKREIGNHDYWSWNLALQNPLRNRLLAGYLLCRTGLNSSPLYGAIVDPYMEMTSTGTPSGVFYPVQGGVIDTIQWEGVREGIDDVRYFGALKNYIRDLKDRQLRKDLTDASDVYVAAVLKKPLWSLSPADYQKTRQGMVNQALKLLTVIRSAVPTYPG
ncbi:MAG: hypothetical protein V4671_14740 [Armatimonadota bacterium]